MRIVVICCFTLVMLGLGGCRQLSSLEYVELGEPLMIERMDIRDQSADNELIALTDWSAKSVVYGSERDEMDICFEKKRQQYGEDLGLLEACEQEIISGHTITRQQACTYPDGKYTQYLPVLVANGWTSAEQFVVHNGILSYIVHTSGDDHIPAYISYQDGMILRRYDCDTGHEIDIHTFSLEGARPYYVIEAVSDNQVLLRSVPYEGSPGNNMPDSDYYVLDLTDFSIRQLSLGFDQPGYAKILRELSIQDAKTIIDETYTICPDRYYDHTRDMFYYYCARGYTIDQFTKDSIIFTFIVSKEESENNRKEYEKKFEIRRNLVL